MIEIEEAPKFKLKQQTKPKISMKQVATANFIEKHKRETLFKKTGSLP